MRRKILSLFFLLSVLLIMALALDSCRPRDDVDDSRMEIDRDLSESISAIASPIATLDLSHLLLRFRIRYVPPGWFSMGSDPEDDKLARGDEEPQHDVTESGFWMGESEVTNKEYAECVKSGACSLPSLRPTGPTNHYSDPAYDDHPVVGVDWFQASTYCEWVNSRLPTEAEWEKAARGELGYIYPWGNETPTCDRTNMNGCQNEDGTKSVASYPLGISPFGLYDMAGNVREWTADWYKADAYLTAVSYNPAGASEGEKKVVRGGGFNDFEENLRTTTRLAYPPDDDFDDVGFRCVPVTQSYAPVCEPTYTTFCYDPDIPTTDEPCVPGQGVPGEEGLTFLGYGCPMNKTVVFQVNSNGGGNTGYTATVDGTTFECQPSSAGDDVMDCIGPETPMGTSVEIVVCAPGSTPVEMNGAAALESGSGVQMVKFDLTKKVSLMTATTSNCPDGYVLDEATGACVRDETQPECPDGWTYDRKNQQCVPNDPEEDCPETTTFSANLGGCQPDDGECPQGYYLTALKVCEPDQNRQDDCPPGYYFNAKINCCEPVPPDNYGCPDGYYFNANYQRCLPLDDNNCPFGMTYNGYGQCDQDPDMPSPEDEPEGDCPPGLLAVAANQCDQPEDGYDENNPEPGTLLRSGDSLTSALVVETGEDGQEDCQDGYYFAANFNRCIQRDENDCPLGYYMDEKLGRCRPTNGPGSPCPLGYVFNYMTNCCVPQPGMDSTYCPEEEEQTQTTAGTPISSLVPFANTSFDMLTGLCVDGSTTEGEDNQEDPCPPGTFSTNFTNCDQYPGDEEVPGTSDEPEELKRLQAQCPPEYWNQETNTCDYPEPDCGENEYFDRKLGYCVPIQPDCCELGQDFSAMYEQCLPVATKPRDGECPDGYELINGVCWLIGRTEGGSQCWTFTINTPRCVGPCEVGLIYNELTGRCEKPVQTDPCEGINCEVCRKNQNCPKGCCGF